MARRAGCEDREVFSVSKKKIRLGSRSTSETVRKKPISVTMTNIAASTKAL